MRWRNTETPTFSGHAGTKPAVVETLDAVDESGNVCASINKSVTGAISFTVNGSAVGGGGGGSYEVATESPATGSNDTFTFTGPPTLVFRNGVMELRLGSVVGNTFVFDVEPMADDDIEGLV